MRITLIIAILAMSMTMVLAGRPVGAVTNTGGTTITLPVYHDTTRGRNVAELTRAERAFIASVPCYDNLRARVQQMLLAGVVHVPVGGRYDTNNPACNWAHYDGIYQSWTAPKKVTVPLIAGPQGPRGNDGVSIVRTCINECGHLLVYYSNGCCEDVGLVVGRDGRDGCDAQAPAQTVINNISYNLTPYNYGSAQMLGTQGAMVSSMQLLGVSLTPSSDIDIRIDNKNINNNSNSNANTNLNNNVINTGPGSATGTVDGGTDAGSGSGN